jgi:transcriptional regulator with XRE-family HTH domain
MKDTEVTLGSTLRGAREAQGLDRKQLAELLSVAPSQVTRWEADEKTPSVQSLVVLARQLELRTADLFSMAGLPVPDELTSLPAMLRAEYELPPEAIADIQTYITDVAKRYRDKRR